MCSCAKLCATAIIDHMNTSVMTVAMAAKVLGLSRRRVLELIQAGQIEPLQKSPGPTGAFILATADVEALAESRAKAVAK